MGTENTVITAGQKQTSQPCEVKAWWGEPLHTALPSFPCYHQKEQSRFDEHQICLGTPVFTWTKGADAFLQTLISMNHVQMLM